MIIIIIFSRRMIHMKKLNNKGFSLVELIIVIAIMAILVGVVGTQVIPYLENSRQAKDYQILSSWNTAAMSAYSSSAAKIDSTKNYVISISVDDPCTYTVKTAAGTTDDATALITKYFKDLTNIDTFKKSSFESKKAKNELTSVTITIYSSGDIILETNGNTFDAIESK